MPHEDLAGRTIAGYRLLEHVGEGGTATVYRAEHGEQGQCAVKILKQGLRDETTAVKRFLREAEYGARVAHPAVVRTHDFGEQDGLYYLALEWAVGEPLSEFVHRSGRLAPDLVVHIVDLLAGALMAAHEVGIIHRDLKPENIVYNPETRDLRLLDFGIARDAQQDAADRLTRAGFFVGTLNYVAPETLSGELVSESADIYSVATITYYLLTGQHPYSGKTPRELFRQLLSEPPTPLNEAVSGLVFPSGLEAALMRGLAKQPQERQATVRELADQLKAGMEGQLEESQLVAEKGGMLGTIKSLFGSRRGSEKR